jgi:uncharacterized protein with HEPN domain
VKDDAAYLRHVLEAIRRIEENTVGGCDAFMGSHMIQDAVLRNLQTLAESTQRLSPSIKQAHPEVDWRALSGFRNVLVHDYLGIDLDQVWAALHRDMPTLRTAAETALEGLDRLR